MDKLDKRLTRAQLINQWAQIVGIVIAGVWACSLFVHREFIRPAAVPVNVAIELSLSPMTATRLAGGPVEDVIPLELTMSVKNPSTRPVALLSSVFVVSGNHFGPPSADFDHQLTLDRQKLPKDQQFVPDTGRFLQRHAGSVSRTVVAMGEAFPDDVLKPNETLRRQVVVYVPNGKYDSVRARVHVPSAKFEKRLQVEWRLVPGTDVTQSFLYELKEGGRVPVAPDGDLYDVEKGLDLQRAKSSVEIALPPTAVVTGVQPKSPIQ